MSAPDFNIGKGISFQQIITHVLIVKFPLGFLSSLHKPYTYTFHRIPLVTPAQTPLSPVKCPPVRGNQ